MSAKIRAIQNLYRRGRVTLEQLRASVPSIITEEEFAQITGDMFGEG